MGLRTYDYIVTLKPTTNYKIFDWISNLLMLLSVGLVAYAAYYAKTQKELIIELVCIVAILITWFYSFKVVGKYSRSLLWAAIVLGAVYMNIWLLLVYGIAAYLERQVKFQQEIGFDETGITFNSFPAKKYQWHEVSNVILKDDIITIDLYNNKIIQREIDSDTDEDMQKEFNEYCRSHLLSV